MNITSFRPSFQPLWIDRFRQTITSLESKITIIAISSLAILALAYIAYKRGFFSVVVEKKTTRPKPPPLSPDDKILHDEDKKEGKEDYKEELPPSNLAQADTPGRLYTFFSATPSPKKLFDSILQLTTRQPASSSEKPSASQPCTLSSEKKEEVAEETKEETTQEKGLKVTIEEATEKESVSSTEPEREKKEEVLEKKKDESTLEKIIEVATEESTEKKSVSSKKPEPEPDTKTPSRVRRVPSDEDKTPLKPPLPPSVKDSPKVSPKIKLMQEKLFAKKQEMPQVKARRNLADDEYIQRMKNRPKQNNKHPPTLHPDKKE